MTPYEIASDAVLDFVQVMPYHSRDWNIRYAKMCAKMHLKKVIDTLGDIEKAEQYRSALVCIDEIN